jgi:hypothetical protein
MMKARSPKQPPQMLTFQHEYIISTKLLSAMKGHALCSLHLMAFSCEYFSATTDSREYMKDGAIQLIIN